MMTMDDYDRLLDIQESESIGHFLGGRYKTLRRKSLLPQSQSLYLLLPPISIKLVSCLLPVALHISPSIQYSPAVPAVPAQYCTPPPTLEGATGARRGNCLRRYARCASASVTARTTVVFRSLTGRHIMKVIQTF